MLKRLTSVPLLTCFLLSVVSQNRAEAQCPAGYTLAQLNWDNMDYYYNSGSNVAPYGFSNPSNGNYVSNTMEQTQRFAIGTTTVTIVTSNSALVNPAAGASAENGTHTANIANYTGDDVQYNPSANGQNIVMTFASSVSAPNFTLYDLDANSAYTVTATNSLGVATAVNVTTYPGTVIAIGVNPLIRTLTVGSGSNVANNVSTAAATINVPGLVNSITITINTIGSDPVFWLSDINACVFGTFPTNWHQGANNRPFVGPTQNMPDYFLATPDNNGAYMVDPATATARLLFNDPTKTYINSFGYDPYNRYLYYITEDPSLDYSNKQVKRYNYNTETSSILINDITAAPFNIPTMNAGVESAACAFYNGCLYLGIEGGSHSTGGGSPTITTRETIVYRIDFDVSSNPISATQVFATNASNSGAGSQTTIHDWGDIIIRNGIIYDCNTARNSGNDYSQSKFHHFNMMTGAVTNVYNNPTTNNWNGQIGMNWAQNLYYFRGSTAGNSVIGTYDGAGNCGAPQTITLVGGGVWPGNSGDASDPFRPKCDFGDAPASYDPYTTPATQSPAVHERADTMWIGTTTSETSSWTREFLKRGTNGTADADDGVTFVPFLQPGTHAYLVQASFYNNSSGNATAIAWVDFNGNGTFDAAEGAQVYPAGAPIPPGGAVVTRWFFWPTYTTPLLNGSTTYLRIRFTATAAGMTTSHATGYFTKGEVEDYLVPVDNYPLASRFLNFNASLQNKKVKLNWSVVEETGVYSYEVERSRDNTNWSSVGTVQAHGTPGTYDYQSIDINPLKGVSYYRLKIIEGSGMNHYSEIRAITFNEFNVNLTIAPNPAKEKTTLKLDVNESHEATIRVLNMQGGVVLSLLQRLNTGSNTIELTLDRSFNSGMYIVRVSVGNETIYKKLIVNK